MSNSKVCQTDFTIQLYNCLLLFLILLFSFVSLLLISNWLFFFHTPYINTCSHPSFITQMKDSETSVPKPHIILCSKLYFPFPAATTLGSTKIFLYLRGTYFGKKKNKTKKKKKKTKLTNKQIPPKKTKKTLCFTYSNKFLVLSCRTCYKNVSGKYSLFAPTWKKVVIGK